MKKNELTKFPDVNDLELLQIFEEWIYFISSFYSKKNTIQPYDLDDLQQFVRSRLLEQLPKIKANFKGGSKIRTYISAIILNFCREFRKKHCSKSIMTQTEINDWNHLQHNQSNSTEENIAVAYEIKKMERILIMFGLKAPKVKLALKVYYGHRVSKKDFSDYYQNKE